MTPHLKEGHKNNQMSNVLNVFLQYYNASIQNKGQRRSQNRIMAAKAFVFELSEIFFQIYVSAGIEF